MPDILIRDVDDDVIARIDDAARSCGMSRSEYLRQQLQMVARVEDVRRSVDLAQGARDDDLMRQAWGH